MDSALLFDSVRFARGDRPIVTDFTLTVARGDHLLLLGPSGSGKTTLINLAAGLLTPDSGRVAVAGQTMPAGADARDALRRQHVGIVFQTLRLVSALGLADNLALAARLAGKPADDIPRLLDELGLAHRAAARPRALSQGEAQRAAIARAVAARPTLLLADEPTSALDDANAATVARLLMDTAARHGSTLVIATHDARVRAHFDRVVELGAR